MHLTNFSINKKSQKFKLPDETFKTDDTSHKQLFTSVMKQLAHQGKDVKALLEHIKSLAQKSVIALQPYLKNAYHCFISTNHKRIRSFQILGLDILVDSNMHPWLVEINANPSLNVYVDNPLPNGDIEQNLSEVDKYVKTTLVSDVLRVVTMPKEQLP